MDLLNQEKREKKQKLRDEIRKLEYRAMNHKLSGNGSEAKVEILLEQRDRAMGILQNLNYRKKHHGY